MQRRKFIRNTASITLGWTIVPRSVLGRGFVPPSDQLAIAGVGAGNQGFENLSKLASDKNNRIVSLCDVDDLRSLDARKSWSNASYFNDFRVMIDKANKEVDAIVVSIPDHNHAVAALAAMQYGKHVYLESPLTHDLYEAQVIQAAAKKYKVVTQMGNQGSSHGEKDKIRHWINKGIIGEVKKVHIWTHKKLQTPGATGAKRDFAIPKGFDWVLWLGTAPDRRFDPKYLDGGWSSWVDFGTGSLGSEGPHLFDVPLSALHLDVPVGVQIGAGLAPVHREARQFPESATIHFRCNRKNGSSVELIWYDGGLLPPRPSELQAGEMMGDSQGGMLFEGSKYKLIAGYYGRNPKILPSTVSTKLDLSYIPEKNNSIETHQTDWASACRNSKPVELAADFSKAGLLTETILLGNLALLAYSLKSGNEYIGRKELLWNSQLLKITNCNEANQFIKREYAHGFSLRG